MTEIFTPLQLRGQMCEIAVSLHFFVSMWAFHEKLQRKLTLSRLDVEFLLNFLHVPRLQELGRREKRVLWQFSQYTCQVWHLLSPSATQGLSY